MTNFDFDGRINALNFSLSQNGNIKISLEVNADKPNNVKDPHCKRNSACINSIRKMNNLNVDLTQATNYLIQLFYKTNQKYSCTRTKVAKLLSIVAFKYAREGELAFEETIYKYDNCGTAIREIMNRFKDSDIYSLCTYKDNAKTISEKINEKANIPNEYKETGKLTVDVKKNIESVFLSFGAFSPASLGECLNPIVNLAGVTVDDNRVNISKIEHLHLDDFSSEHSENPLLKFLFK